MRKRITIPLFIFVLANTVSATSFLPADTVTGKKFPENPIKYSGILKTNPLPVIWGAVPFTAEYRYVQEVMVTPRQSSQWGFSYLGKSIIVKAWENDRNKKSKPYSINIVITGYRVQVSHRVYLKKEYAGSPIGWYLSPHLSYATAKISDRFNYQYGVYLLARQFDMNLLIGKQKIRRKNYVVDYFFGLGYQKNRLYRHHAASTGFLPVNTRDIPGYGSPVKLTIGFNLGYAFRNGKK